MIGPEEIRRQAERRYREYLGCLVEGKDPFPIRIRFGKVGPGEVSRRYAGLKAEIAALKAASDQDGGPSFRVEWAERTDRLAGSQLLPVRIYFPDEASLVGYLRKGREVQRFREATSILLGAFPVLTPWVARHPHRLLEHAAVMDKVVTVLRWFLANPRPGILLREIAAVEDTKFVEDHRTLLRELLDQVLPPSGVAAAEGRFEERYGLRRVEPTIRVRLLDASVAGERLSGISDLAVPAGDLGKLAFPELRTVLVVENKTSFTNVDVFLSVPSMEGVLAVFGSGHLAASLRSAGWLGQRRLLYWGDTDTQGLRILAQFRRAFPRAESVLMDEATFDRFPEARSDAPADRGVPPPELDAAELSVFHRLAGLDSRNRLEQERIPAWWAAERLAAAVSRLDPPA